MLISLAVSAWRPCRRRQSRWCQITFSRQRRGRQPDGSACLPAGEVDQQIGACSAAARSAVMVTPVVWPLNRPASRPRNGLSARSSAACSRQPKSVEGGFNQRSPCGPPAPTMTRFSSDMVYCFPSGARGAVGWRDARRHGAAFHLAGACLPRQKHRQTPRFGQGGAIAQGIDISQRLAWNMSAISKGAAESAPAPGSCPAGACPPHPG